MLISLSIPQSWFSISKNSCLRRTDLAKSRNSREEDDDEDMESYYHVKGRLFVAPQVLFFHSNFGECHCVPISPDFFPAAANSNSNNNNDVPLTERDLPVLNQTVSILERSGQLIPFHASHSYLSLSRGSFYVNQNVPILALSPYGKQVFHFALSESEFNTLSELNPVRGDEFLLSTSLSLLDAKFTPHTSSEPQVALETYKSGAALPGENERFHCGVIKKRNKSHVGWKERFVILCLGRLFTLNLETGVLKCHELAKCNVLSDKSFECGDLGFACENSQERDGWIRKIHICARFPFPVVTTSTPSLPPTPSSHAMATSLGDDAFNRFQSQLDRLSACPVQLSVSGLRHAHLDQSMKQSQLDFERDRVRVNSKEVLPCLLPNLVTVLEREIQHLQPNQPHNPEVDAVQQLVFIRMLLLASTRTQCGGFMYEAIQTQLRPPLDRVVIVPDGEEDCIDLTISREDLREVVVIVGGGGQQQQQHQASVVGATTPPATATTTTTSTTSTPKLLDDETSHRKRKASFYHSNSGNAGTPPPPLSSSSSHHRRSTSNPEFFLKFLSTAESASSTNTSSPLRQLANNKMSSFLVSKKQWLQPELPFFGLKCVTHCVMHFVVKDVEAEGFSLLARIRAEFEQVFYLIEGKSVAKDQGHVSFSIVRTEPVESTTPPTTAATTSVVRKATTTSVEEEDDDDSVHSFRVAPAETTTLAPMEKKENDDEDEDDDDDDYLDI